MNYSSPSKKFIVESTIHSLRESHWPQIKLIDENIVAASKNKQTSIVYAFIEGSTYYKNNQYLEDLISYYSLMGYTAHFHTIYDIMGLKYDTHKIYISWI